MLARARSRRGHERACLLTRARLSHVVCACLPAQLDGGWALWGWRALTGDHVFRLKLSGELWTRHDFKAKKKAADGKGMNALCDSLLRGGDPNAEPLCELKFGTMVSQVDCAANGPWTLVDKKGVALGDFDWVVITSTALAHPRWRSMFGQHPQPSCASDTLGAKRS